MSATDSDVCEECLGESGQEALSYEIRSESKPVLLCNDCFEGCGWGTPFICAGCGYYEWGRYGSSIPEIYGYACFCESCVDEACACHFELDACDPAGENECSYRATGWDDASTPATKDRPLFVYAGDHGEGMSVSEFLASQGENVLVAWKDLLENLLESRLFLEQPEHAHACGFHFAGDAALIRDQTRAHAQAHPALADAYPDLTSALGVTP